MRQYELPLNTEHCLSLFLGCNGSYRAVAFRPVKLYGYQPGTDFSNKASVMCVNQRLRNNKRVLENLRCNWDGLENASQGNVYFSSCSRRQGTPVCLGKPSKGWKQVPECFAHGPLSLIRAA